MKLDTTKSGERRFAKQSAQEAKDAKLAEVFADLGALIGLDFDGETLDDASDLFLKWVQEKAEEFSCDATFPAVLDAATAKGVDLFPGAADVRTELAGRALAEARLTVAERGRCQKLGLTERAFAAAKAARSVTSRRRNRSAS